jgi:hypothetical protein
MRKFDDFLLVDDRIRGFVAGYFNRFGTAADFLGNKDFIIGWGEGAGLRIDELRAQAQAEVRKARS